MLYKMVLCVSRRGYIVFYLIEHRLLSNAADPFEESIIINDAVITKGIESAVSIE